MLSRSQTPMKRSAFKPKASKLTLKPMKRGTKKLRQVRKVAVGSEAWLKQKLTIAFSKFIRARDPYCYCGRQSTECGHYFSRAIPSTEYDPENCLGTCHGCNGAHEENKEPMKRALIARIGEERFEELTIRSWDHVKLTPLELEDLAERYRERT